MSVLTHARPTYLGTAAERAVTTPSADAVGVTWWETDTDKLYVWNGTAWTDIAAEGWPFTTINVDLTDADADYSAIQDAINSVAAGGSATILVGPGSYAESLTIANKDLTIVALGGDARVAAGSEVTVTGSITVTATTRNTNVSLVGMIVNGQISVTGQAAPTPYVLNAFLKNIYSLSVASARVVTGVYGVVRIDESYFTYGAGNVVTLDTQNAALVNQIYNSRIEGNVSAAADSTLWVAGLMASTVTFSGAGTITFRDKITALMATDGSPDPAWSTNGAGDLVAASSVVLKGQSSNFNDLGTTTLAEKLGNIYLGTAKDIYPSNDEHGMWQRLVNYGRTPDEHWKVAGADDIAWTGWAAYTSFITPNTIAIAGSQYQVYDSGSTGRMFRYRSYINAQTNIACLAGLDLNTEAGVMVDDGVNNADGEGANNFVRVFLEFSAGPPATINLCSEYRSGGAAKTKVTHISNLPPTDMVAFQLTYGIGTRWTNWSANVYIGMKNMYGSGPAFPVLAAIASSLTWTPARHGIYGREATTFREIVWDWFDE